MGMLFCRFVGAWLQAGLDMSTDPDLQQNVQIGKSEPTSSGRNRHEAPDTQVGFLK